MKLSRRAFIRLGLLGTLGVLGGVGWFNRSRIEAARVDLNLPNLPSAWDGLTIAQLTDIHAGPLVSEKMIRAAGELAEKASPDLVVLTGDLISGATRILGTRVGGFSDRDLDLLLQVVQGLKPALGVFAVLGNHEFWAGPEAVARVTRGLEAKGVRVLRNEPARLERNGQPLWLAGVDDYWSSRYSLKAAVKSIPEQDFTILLSHNPDVNEDVELLDREIDLILAGHTHGGQIVFPLIGAPYLPSAYGQKYRAGLVRDGSRLTYVSRGVGVFLVPLRFNCPAEVTILTLHRSAA